MPTDPEKAVAIEGFAAAVHGAPVRVVTPGPHDHVVTLDIGDVPALMAAIERRRPVPPPPPPKGRAPFQDALDREWAEADRRERRDIRIITAGGAFMIALVVVTFVRVIVGWHL